MRIENRVEYCLLFFFLIVYAMYQEREREGDRGRVGNVEHEKKDIGNNDKKNV